MRYFEFQRLVFLKQLGVLLSAILLGIVVYVLLNLLFNNEDLKYLRNIFSRETILKT